VFFFNPEMKGGNYWSGKQSNMFRFAEKQYLQEKAAIPDIIRPP
jgi:hypothetical protein